MKARSLTVLITCLYTINFSNAQRAASPWGVWGYGKLESQKDLKAFKKYNLDGFNITALWSDIQPQKDSFNWSPIDSTLRLLTNIDLWAGVLVTFGQNSPSWIYEDVPKVKTQGGNDDGPYPYYLDEDYKKYYYNILKQIAKHLASYNEKTKSHLVYWQIAEGSTGDAEPYKGAPIDSQYNISEVTWQQFRRAAWDSADAYAQGRTYRFLFNDGNDGQNLDYIEKRFPGDMDKDGHLSHQYSFDGELVYFTRQVSHIHDVLFNYRTRGEAQTFWKAPWWQDAPLKQSFTLVTSALAGGLDMFNITTGWFNQNTKDQRPTDFFNTYGGRRTGRLSARGFIALRDVIDFADTFRFPVKQYGPVIDPLKQSKFVKKIDEIEAAYGEEQPTYAWWLKARTVSSFINPTRVNTIVDEFATQGALYNTKGDQYRNDFGVLMAHNYGKFINQVNENETSIGRYRVGPDSAMYGRYARAFLLNEGKGKMEFKVSDSLFNTTGSANIRVQITVTYFDAGNGKWTIAAGKDDINKFKVTNMNTNEWKQVTAGFDNFTTHSLDNDVDFMLNYDSSDNTSFALIEFINLDKADQLPAVTKSNKPRGISITQNYPNPFTNTTSISYTIPKEIKNAELVIADNNTGIIVRRIPIKAAEGTIQVDATQLKNGVYNYALMINGKTVETKKMVIMH